MKKLTDAANRYLRACDWRDIAVLKICLCALGVLLGLAVPGRKSGRRPGRPRWCSRRTMCPWWQNSCRIFWKNPPAERIFDAAAENSCKIPQNGVS